MSQKVSNNARTTHSISIPRNSRDRWIISVRWIPVKTAALYDWWSPSQLTELMRLWAGHNAVQKFVLITSSHVFFFFFVSLLQPLAWLSKILSCSNFIPFSKLGFFFFCCWSATCVAKMNHNLNLRVVPVSGHFFRMTVEPKIFFRYVTTPS